MRILFIFIGLCLSLIADAQTYTFECVASGRLSGDSCDVCPNTIIESRSFNGLVIFRDSAFYKWVDQPYSIRVKPGDIVEYWEHAVNPFSERITIPLDLTGFSTIQGMADSTWCNSPGPQRWQNLDFDSISAIKARVRITGSNTGFALKAGQNLDFSFDTDTLTISVDTTGLGGGGGIGLDTLVAIPPAAGFTISGSPAYASRDTITFSLANDLAALEALSGTGIIARTSAETYSLRTITAGTGSITVTDGDGVAGNPTINNTDPDQSTTNEIQVYGHAPAFNLYTNTLDHGGGTWSIAGAGIAVVTSTAGAITITATEAQTANNGLSDNEASGIFRLGNRYMNGSDGLFSNDRKVNLNAFRLFIGDNTDSTLLHIDGTNDRVGIHTTAPGRTFTVNGEVEIKDLVTTNPTLLVGADGNGVLSEVTLGTGLSYSGTTLNATGGSNYQTFRDDGFGMTQRAAANFVASGRVSTTLTDDLGNGETEVLLDIVTNSIGNTHIRQGVARSVIGVTGNATANVADIQGTADQVLRVTTAGTALSFGTVATGGIADDAVTYAKIQNAAANNVLLGNNNGANTDYEELNAAAVQTMLGYIDAITLANQQIAYGSDANTITSEAAFLYDAANDRQTINCATPGLGAGAAILNLANVGTDGTGEFIRMAGSIDGNMIAGMYNSSTTASDATLFTISQAGNSAGDAVLQLQISGTGGNTTSLGVDNSDANKFKITPNGNTPGGNANASFVATNDAIPLYGFNLDNPSHPLDVSGRARANEFIGNGLNEPTVGALGNGLGTSPTINDITGTNNGFSITFTTGTTPTSGGDMFTVTYATAYPGFSIPVMSQVNDNAAAEWSKFTISSTSGAAFTMKVRTGQTLTASTQYTINYSISGF